MNALNRVAVMLAGLLALAACGSPPSEKVASSSTSSSSAALNPTSTTPAASSVAADVAAIRAAGASKDHAYNTGDADAIQSSYEDDAVLMPPTEHAAKGAVAIGKFLREYLAQLAKGGYTTVVAAPVEIGVSGDLGFRSGTYTVRDKAGATQDSGKWLEVWSKSDGNWHISRDIWNSDSLPLMMPDDEPDDAGDTSG